MGRRRWRTHGSRGFLAALVVSIGAAHPRGDARDADDTTRRDLLTILSEEAGNAARIRERLAELGPGIVPDLFALLIESHARGIGPLETPMVESALLDAMQAWPSDLVVSGLAEAVKDGDLPQRLFALQTAGALVDAQGLRSFLSFLAGFEIVELCRPEVARGIELALATILERDPKAVAILRRELQDVDLAVHLPVVRALGRLGHGDGIQVLERMLGHDPDLDVHVLEALGRLDPWALAFDPRSPAALLEDYLDVEDPRARRQAAISLGRLRERYAIDALIVQLQDEDPAVRRAAHWALREVTDFNGELDGMRWGHWFDVEREWFEKRSGPVIETLCSTNPSRAIAALQEIGLHGSFSGELVGDVAFALTRRDVHVHVAVVACSTLGQIDDLRAVPYLLDALRDDREAVRTAATEALRRLHRNRTRVQDAPWPDPGR